MPRRREYYYQEDPSPNACGGRVGYPKMTQKPITLRELADLLDGEVDGDAALSVRGISALQDAARGELTFVSDPRRAGKLASINASAAIVGRDFSAARPEGMSLVRVDDVGEAVLKVLQHFAPPEDLASAGVHPSATVSDDAQLGSDVSIGPGALVADGAKIGDRCALCANVIVGAGASIGAGCVLFEGVVVRHHCRIGKNVRIGPNSVIGSEGFGYYSSGGKHHRIPHAGGVIIEDNVDIGACCCVDRAKFGDTVIGAGTKIDNLVQVAHNVKIGRGCLIAALGGIGGSAVLGNYVVFGGHVGIKDNITIGEGVKCGAYTAVAADAPDGEVLFGIPAEPAVAKMRTIKAGKKLPDLLKRVKILEKKVSEIASSKDD